MASSVIILPLAVRVVTLAAAAVPLPKIPSSVPVNPVPTTSPATVKVPLPSVNKSVSFAAPIVPLFLIIRSSDNVRIWEALKVAAVVPPVVIVITSEPENAISVLASASPLIESNDTAPILVMSRSPKSPSALFLALLIS